MSPCLAAEGYASDSIVRPTRRTGLVAARPKNRRDHDARLVVIGERRLLLTGRNFLADVGESAFRRLHGEMRLSSTARLPVHCTHCEGLLNLAGHRCCCPSPRHRRVEGRDGDARTNKSRSMASSDILPPPQMYADWADQSHPYCPYLR
jgi:hypothetical protein